MILNELNRISLLWKRFTPLEEFLLRVLQQTLSEDARAINQKRIERINYVSRPLDWTEIMFYQKRFGRVVHDEEAMFPRRSQQDIVLAEIKFSPVGSPKLWTSKIYAVSGQMFSMVTRPTPKAIAFSPEFVLRSVRFVDNPMDLKEISLLEKVRSQLPADYQTFAGKEISGWQVFTPSEIYQVSLKDSDYILLAIRGEDEYLAVRDDPTDANVYYIPDHESSPKVVGLTMADGFRIKS